MESPLVYVLVINWNGLEHLRECFETLLAGTYERCRFLLLDNGSDDDSVVFVRETFGHDDRVEVVELGENLGWSRGNNVGLERAIADGADYALLLNNDTAIAADCIEQLVAMGGEQQDLGAIAPKMMLYDHPDLLNSLGLECSVIGSCGDRGLGRLDGPKWETSEPVVGVCGGAFLVRVTALWKSGLLPTDFDIYLDDLDLSLRMWNAGYDIATCPGAIVHHKFSATMGTGEQYRRKYYLNTRNRMRIPVLNFPIERRGEAMRAFVRGECKALGRASLDGELWKIGVHLRSWASLWSSRAELRSERSTRRADGLLECRFWDLVRKDRLYFEGAEFPEQGWYPPRTIQGRKVQPISRAATVDVAPGPLRVTHANCYPRLGPTEVDVVAAGEHVATLSTLSVEDVELAVPGGSITFRAGRIFDADDTGERADFGGWVAVSTGR
jgi:GT2 family glycosyltransferase